MRNRLLSLALPDRIYSVHMATATPRATARRVRVYRLLLIGSVLLNIVLWLR